MYMLINAMSYLFPAIIVSIGYLSIVILILRKKQEPISWCHLILLFMLAINLTIIFSVTLSPVFGFSLNPPSFNRVNLIPFQVFSTISSNPRNFYGNIIMFLPFGCLLVLISKRYQNIFVTILAGGSLSVIIEVLQLFGSRGTDIDDLLLNILGTICGYFVGILILTAIPSSQLKLGILIKNGKILRNKSGSIGVLFIVLLITVITTGFYEKNHYFNAPVHEKIIEENSNITNAIENDINIENAFNKNNALNKDNVIPNKSDKDIRNAPNSNMAYPTTEMTSLSLSARNAYLWEVKADHVLYEKESLEPIAPASTTRMLTALVVLDYCDPAEEVVVGDEIYLIAYDASRIWLSVGDQLTVKQLLDGLLLPSGSDAAYTLAAYAGRKISSDSNLSIKDAITTFIAAMNKKAIRIGATNTNFTNPDGYDARNQYTTASDLAYIAKEFMENTVLGDIALSLRIRDVWLNGKDVTYSNTNQLLDPESTYFYKDVIGLKTGTTDNAGNCLVSAAKINGTIYICVVMGCSEEGRWLDSLELYASIKH